jgi:integrase
MLEVCKCRNSPWLWYMVSLALLTAMRAGELRAFTWEDVGPRVIHLKDTKNGTARFVPLSSQAVAVLDAWRGLVEPQDKKLPVFPVTQYALCNAFRAAMKHANKHHGMPHMTFHDLRHVATTNLAKKLTNILELSAVTGHKSVQMLRRYYHPDVGELADKLG